MEKILIDENELLKKVSGGTLLDNEEIALPCPKCGEKIKTTYGFVLSKKPMECPHCKCQIQFIRRYE